LEDAQPAGHLRGVARSQQRREPDGERHVH